MKKIILSICTLVLISLFHISCNKEDIKPNKKEGTVEFGFSLKAPSHSGAQKSSMKTLAAEPAAIVVSIKKANGNSAYTMQKVDLYNMNGYYISKPLSFLPGSYTIEQFFVVDAAGNVMYATPFQDSPKAYLVSKPLPISFTVSKDAVTKIVPEVLSTEDSTPEDFGYSTFSFEVVKTFDFLIGVFVYNESTQNFELTNANLTIVAASKSIYTDTLAAITNKITINDGYDNYFLTVTKDGYKTWTDTLTSTELKLYFRSEDKGPLVVILEKGAVVNGLPCPGTPTVTDADGNVYPTVQIGNQCWMKKNLNVGVKIINRIPTNNGIFEKNCYNNDDNKCAEYGGLYYWDEAMQYSKTENTQGICPNSWHIPSINEYVSLINFLGGDSIAGKKLKESGTTHWNEPNTADNSSGFTALPGGTLGIVQTDFSSETLGILGYFWSSTPAPPSYGSNGAALLISLPYSYSHVNVDNENSATETNSAYSIRCIKNN
jgi:uncharacterized protein (TIGR02145 family)